MNEVFHAFVDKVVEENPCCAWLYELMRDEANRQYGGRFKMVEEAMSETVDYIFRSYANTERYRRAGRDWLVPDLPGPRAPEHNEKGQEWAGIPEADVPLSPALYGATLWLLENGCENPMCLYKNAENVRAALERFAEQKGIDRANIRRRMQVQRGRSRRAKIY